MPRYLKLISTLMDSNNGVCSRNNSCSRSSTSTSNSSSRSGRRSCSSSVDADDGGFRSRNSSSSSDSRSCVGGADSGLGRVKVRCELCKEAASLYCPADEARLCWDCDARIHSANFLVARHSRALLCPCCGALLSGHPSRELIRRFCRSCSDQGAASFNQLQESKVERNDDDDESPSCLQELLSPSSQQARKRPPPPACSVEGMGDSEELNFCSHLLSSANLSTTFKRRKNFRRPHLIIMPQPYTL